MNSAPAQTPPSSSPAIYRLEKALDSDGSRYDISEALEHAQNQSDPLPDFLLFRAQERIDAERMVERRRLAFVVLSVVSIFGAIVGSFALASLEQERSLKSTEIEFQELLQAEQWDEAERFLNRLDEPTRMQPLFAEGTARITQAREKETKRVAAFKTLLSELQSSPPITWKLEDIRTLEQLASSDEEIALAREILARAEEQQLQSKANRTDDQTSELESIQDEIEAFLAKDFEAMPRGERMQRRQELTSRINRLINANLLSNPELTASARQQLTLLSQESNRGTAMIGRNTQIALITESVGDDQAYPAALEEFSSKFPEDPLSNSLREKQSIWSVIEATRAWERVLSSPQFQDPTSVNSEQARKWFDSVQQLSIDHARHPLAKLPRKWQSYYQSITARSDLIDQLKESLDSDLLSTMYIYPSADGQLYYSQQAPDSGGLAPHVVPVIQDLALRTKKKNFGIQFNEEVLPNVSVAPHSKFASEARPIVASMTEVDFTPNLFRLIELLRSNQTEPQMDPVFKIGWMRRLLLIASQGSVPLRESFSDWKQRIDSAPIKWNVNWIAPERQDPELTQSRQTASIVLEEVGDWDARIQTMLRLFKQFRTPRQKPPRWIGWITEDNTGHSAILKEDPGADPIYAVVPSDNTQDTSMIQLDRTAGQRKIQVTDPSAQIAGAIIYVVPGGLDE